MADLVDEVLKHWPGRWEDRSDAKAVHEAKLLQLSTDKANALLGWSPVWSFAETIARTVDWYSAADRKVNLLDLTQRQIQDYCATAATQKLRWANSETKIS